MKLPLKKTWNTAKAVLRGKLTQVINAYIKKEDLKSITNRPP